MKVKDGQIIIQWPDGLLNKSVWRNRLRSFGTFLLACLSPTIEMPNPAKANKIAFLDGIRGLAALAVYCNHHTAFTHVPPDRRLNHAFGFRGEYYFANLPFVRLFFYGGAPAVQLFFIISGYAMSIAPMRMIHGQRPGDALKLCMQISSSFPRRWIRLYLPVIATTWGFMTTWHLLGIQSTRVAPADSYFQEFGRWLNEFREGSYIYLQSEGPAFGRNDYNHHIWSIAVEYRGSCFIYVTLLVYLALGYGPNTRFWISLGLFSYFQFVVDSPFYACFVFGMMLCDLEWGWEMSPHQLHDFLKSNMLQKHRWLNYVLLFVSLYLAGHPLVPTAEELTHEPGWYLFSYFVPYTSSSAMWYCSVYSATIFIVCVPRISLLKRMFESFIFQALAKVSFGFYLVHGPIMWTVGDRLYAAFGRPRNRAEETVPGWINLIPLSDAGPLGMELNALVPHLIIFPLTLWGAAVVTKLIDGPTVPFSKWLFKQPSQKPRTLEADSELKPMLPTSTDQLPK